MCRQLEMYVTEKDWTKFELIEGDVFNVNRNKRDPIVLIDGTHKLALSDLKQMVKLLEEKTK